MSYNASPPAIPPGLFRAAFFSLISPVRGLSSATRGDHSALVAQP